MFPVTALFAALSAFMLVVLSLNVIRTRRQLLVLIGDGGKEAMQRAIRAQANFSEYVPLALILMAMLEADNTRKWIVIVLGVVLLTGRISHAYSLLVYEPRNAGQPVEQRVLFRKAGMIATFAVLISGGLLVLLG